VATLPGTLVADDAIQYRGRRTRIGAFPIGIIPEGFQEPPAPSTAEEVANLMRAIAPSKLVLGVDRLTIQREFRSGSKRSPGCSSSTQSGAGRCRSPELRSVQRLQGPETYV